jgi:hypothetical protein
LSGRCGIFCRRSGIERGVHERLRRGRSDAGPDDGQEILSKIRE